VTDRKPGRSLGSVSFEGILAVVVVGGLIMVPIWALIRLWKGVKKSPPF
jgi:hypothetical protein